METTEPPAEPPSPAPAGRQQIGTDEEQSEHRPPAPTPREHVRTMYQTRVNDIVSWTW